MNLNVPGIKIYSQYKYLEIEADEALKTSAVISRNATSAKRAG